MPGTSLEQMGEDFEGVLKLTIFPSSSPFNSPGFFSC